MKNEKESYETLHIKRYFLSNCLVSEMVNLCLMRKNDEKSITYYCSSLKCKNANGFKYQTLPLMGATRLEAAEKMPDAGRVAPISACVSYQIYRLKSKLEAMKRTVMPENRALMGATRLASGHFFSSLVPCENAMFIHLKRWCVILTHFCRKEAAFRL